MVPSNKVGRRGSLGATVVNSESNLTEFHVLTVYLQEIHPIHWIYKNVNTQTFILCSVGGCNKNQSREKIYYWLHLCFINITFCEFICRAFTYSSNGARIFQTNPGYIYRSAAHFTLHRDKKSSLQNFQNCLLDFPYQFIMPTQSLLCT